MFTDTCGHDRLSLIYRPFIVVRLDEEVTFSEEEDVSAEKGVTMATTDSLLSFL
ncbi:hypothetical protein PAMP_013980 [Pampus punctatissimus]